MNVALLERFENRKLLIATKHGKESVIAPLLEKRLGVTCFTDPNLDTDVLGTFSGEIERESDPVSTLRKKCLWAMERNNCDLAVASEGSFGPHPTIFFANSDDEFLILIDHRHGLEILVREISTETNFNGSDINSEQELLEFAEKSRFPTHALILRPAKSDNRHIAKGITTLEELKRAYTAIRQEFKTVFAETDMRAMYNPSRMAVIARAAQKLVDKIESTCPQCQTPGFGVVEARQGLKCALCGLPTRSTLSYIYQCQKCAFEEEKSYPHGKTAEDPRHCDYCNP